MITNKEAPNYTVDDDGIINFGPPPKPDPIAGCEYFAGDYAFVMIPSGLGNNAIGVFYDSSGDIYAICQDNIELKNQPFSLNFDVNTLTFPGHTPEAVHKAISNYASSQDRLKISRITTRTKASTNLFNEIRVFESAEEAKTFSAIIQLINALPPSSLTTQDLLQLDVSEIRDIIKNFEVEFNEKIVSPFLDGVNSMKNSENDPRCYAKKLISYLDYVGELS